jgi:raffinose/stachyose/melibiose transport system permease protein
MPSIPLPPMQNTSSAARPPRISRRTKDGLVIAMFLAPALILFLLFVIYPIFRSVYFSTFNWNGLGPAVKFVGLKNYVKILSDIVFLQAVKNVLFIVVF